MGLHKSQLGQRRWPISLLSKSQALMPLWRLRAQSRLWVQLKLKSLQKTLLQQMLQMPTALHSSQQELQSWWRPGLHTLVLHKSKLKLQSWWWPAPCKLTRHVSPPLPLNDDDRDGDVCDDGRGDDALCGWLILPYPLLVLPWKSLGLPWLPYA